MRDNLIRDYNLLAVVKAQAVINPAQASAAADLIQGSKVKSRALLELVKVQVPTNPGQAKETANLIHNGIKTTAFVHIAKTQALTNPELANLLFQSALDIAALITDLEDKAKSLKEVAEAIALTDSGRANEIFQEAVQTACSIIKRSFNESKQALTLKEIAKAQALSSPLLAESLFQQAINAANADVRDLNRREEVIGKIAEAQAQAYPEQALAAANLIHDEWIKAQVLLEIARAQISTNPASANHHLGQAIEAAKQSQKDWRTFSIAELSRCRH